MKEDFVTYDIAVKLKDKGYPQNGFHYYNEKGCIDIPAYNLSDEDMSDTVAPQIHEVLKWLREEKNLYIRIELCKGIYFYNVFDTVEYLEDWTHKSYCIGECGNESYEESCLSAINYVIDNLI